MVNELTSNVCNSGVQIYFSETMIDMKWYVHDAKMSPVCTNVIKTIVKTKNCE